MDCVKRYAIYLLVIAGCGGLLFDFGGTIIGPALPYIGPADENPGSLGLFSTAQVSHLSSAVVMCAALACLVAGWLAEKLGRKLMMLVSAAIAAVACLPICLTGGNYAWFFLGRAMQGVAAGFIGVVVPMYLAECLDANSRGKGAGMFQLLEFIGITFCSVVGLVVVHAIGAADDAAVLFRFMDDHISRGLFHVFSLRVIPPSIPGCPSSRQGKEVRRRDSRPHSGRCLPIRLRFQVPSEDL